MDNLQLLSFSQNREIMILPNFFSGPKGAPPRPYQFLFGCPFIFTWINWGTKQKRTKQNCADTGDFLFVEARNFQFQTVFLKRCVLPQKDPPFHLILSWFWVDILLMEEIRQSPVEVGSWNPIIYGAVFLHSRWLTLGFLNHQQFLPQNWRPSDSNEWSLPPSQHPTPRAKSHRIDPGNLVKSCWHHQGWKYMYTDSYTPENQHDHGKPTVWRCIPYWKRWNLHCHVFVFRGVYTKVRSHRHGKFVFYTNPHGFVFTSGS